MPVKRPPVLIPFSQFTGADLEAHQRYHRMTDDKGRYLPFDEFCRGSPSIFLYKSESLSRLNGRQVTLLNIILAEPSKKYSAASAAEMLGVSDNTAHNDLRTLARENLLT